jgi:uncharacterized protein YecE (DUF72 family)
MMSTAGVIRTGTAGWVFAPWRGTFFPEGLVQKKELHYASRHLTSIEINATFRALQKPESFVKWAGETPESFEFAIKGPQIVTHIKRLKNCARELAGFFASGPLAIGDRLGPFIWQLPPNLSFDPAVLEAFMSALPRNIASYLAIAGQADGFKNPPYLEPNGITRFRHAIETRHASFDTPEAMALFTKYNVARVIADTPENPGRTLTADFAYCRLQGPARPDATGYGAEDLDDLAKTISGWRDDGIDTYAYFVHEDKIHAPANAMALAERLGVVPES